MTVSINYQGCQGFDTLQDHHSREGESLVGIPLYEIESIDSLRESFVDNLNSCAQDSSFPWEEAKKEASNYFSEENIYLAEFQRDWQLFGGDDGEEIYDCKWWFLIVYGEEGEDGNDEI